MKIVLNDEETKRFKSFFIEEARRILAERKRAKRESEQQEKKEA